MAGATISYLGPFTGSFRLDLIKSWLDQCSELGIPHSENYAFESVLGD